MTGERSESHGLVCYRCGQTARFPDRKRCECGEPLWFDTDDAAADFEWPDSGVETASGTGIWRYADLLPVGPRARAVAGDRASTSTSEGAAESEREQAAESEHEREHATERERAEPPASVGAAAGATPLVRVPQFDDRASCRLWLKDERANPTGSFKDRGSAVGVAWAAEHDREWVGTVSHGNMAVSVAANAAGIGGGSSRDEEGPNALVLVPDDIATERLAAIAQFDPAVLRVAGDYGRLYDETLDADAPVEFVNSDTPLRVAGQKTTALEICEAFAGGVSAGPRRPAGTETGTGTGTEANAPDAIVFPVSSGGHASATWKALRELRRAGLLSESDLPRLYLVQAAACDPIAAAYREGADEVTLATETGETVAYSIANPNPPSGTRALAAARETGGAVVSVPDDEILAAKTRLAREAGFGVEPSSATTLAGIQRLSEAGELAPDDDVVAVLTGRGFAAASSADAKPETVALGDLPARLRDLTG